MVRVWIKVGIGLCVVGAICMVLVATRTVWQNSGDSRMEGRGTLREGTAGGGGWQAGRELKLVRHRRNAWEEIFEKNDIDVRRYGQGLEKPPAFVNSENRSEFANVTWKDIVRKESRLLATENTLDSPGIIGFDKQDQGKREYYAYQYFLTNLKEYSSSLVLYPFAFDYTPNASEPSVKTEFTKGGVFSMRPEELPTSNVYNYFHWLQSTVNVSFGKAKALYDINIAVLKIEDTFDGSLKDLTFESSSYCNILTSYLGKFTDCLNGTSYWDFKSDSKNSGKTALVMVNEEDIVTQNLLFTPDGGLRFKLLIVPDYYLGAHDMIKNKLGAAGIQKIKDFASAGGMILATGKAGYLLETWEMLPSGLYHTDAQLQTTNPSSEITLDGCDSVSTDFLNSTICLNLKDAGEDVHSFLVSAYLMDQAKAAGLTVAMSYNASSGLKKKGEDGTLAQLTAGEEAFLPFSLHQDYGKGKLFLVNGNPLFKGDYNKVFYNYLFLAMARNVMIDAYLGSKDDNPIPGGEAGVQLDFKMAFINLYDKPSDDVQLHIWFPNFVEPTALPADCALDSTAIAQIDLSALNASSHIKCSKTVVGAFEKFEVLINIVINDHTVTQKKWNILLAAPVVKYIDNETGIEYTYDIGGIRTDAALAAYLSGGMNPDPSAWYPQFGRGAYVDNMFGVENKEDTVGIDVDFVELIPLISPLTDMADQQDVSRAIRFYPDYYNTNSYYFPFRSEVGKNYDYLDYKWLNEKGVVMSADWDTPTKMGKVLRDSSFPNVTTSSTIDVKNCNWSTIVDNLNMVVKEIYYVDSDRFFEHATQRLLVFIDPTVPSGASTLYPGGIPAGMENPNRPGTCKKELLWTRNDIYFYQPDEYIKPPGLNYTHVISVDRYANPSQECISVFGDSRSSIVVPGSFGNTVPGGLIENEYDNEMLKYCDRHKLLMSELEDLTNKNATPIHYLVPVKDQEITRADDIMFFNVNANGTGQHQTYPELKFIYAHRVFLTTAGGQGGRLEIELPAGTQFNDVDTIDPVAAHRISFSVDGIAFYKTLYDKNTRIITTYYKKGGHASNVTRPSVVDMAIEELNTASPISLKVLSYEMVYDISAASSKFEKYLLRTTSFFTASKDRYFSLPAVEMHNKLIRRGDTRIFGYESIGYYSRSGVYTQELEKHRTVYGSAESHHVTDPGVQAINAGFSMISNLGIGWIPFASFVTHGPGLLIPNGPSTSRIEWHDIWGRHWVAPVRSIFPDIPPIPAPVLTFTMTTTFELTKAGTTERVLEWNSDEEIDIRVLIKVFNPYPKSFSITICKDNEVPHFMERECMFEKLRIFDIPDPIYDYQINGTMAPTDQYHINFGSRSVYGYCFDADGTVLKTIRVDEATRIRIRDAHLCADTLDPERLLECSQELADLPTVTRRADGNTASVWMYSPEVAQYFPTNYIKDDMWDMTHSFYEDNPMDKAFKYHLDDGLPGIDYGPSNNPARYKPHNIIAFPIWKGFGFDISYEKSNALARFPQYKGWWSDNLQNRDHTLLAGQDTVNDISVDKDTLLPPERWINARDIINPMTPNLATNRLKTIHVCLFNQHRVKQSVGQQKTAYLPNVVQNNVIPILSELTNNDARYTSYNCDGVYQYSNANISQFEHVIRTNTIRDSMLFSSNLRAQAFETLNIALKMKPFTNVKYEGLAKVQDGGSFTYWNPPNGPNSYLVAGSSVSVVEAKRNDLTISCEVFPQSTATLDLTLYHLMTIKDPAEILREWTYLTYTNNYGFGDSATAVYVGGAQATQAILKPGDYTLIKVTLYNNAGFDWNLLFGAVEAELLKTAPLGAEDLLKRRKRAIQKPTKYNFMVLDIPEELKNYIVIAPSDHNIEVAPHYFDFLSINLATIEDGHSSAFYYRLNLSSSLPDSLTGKVYEIGISLRQGLFDKLPGFNDPTKPGFHDYSLTKIPSMKFGIPYASGPYKGKIFYTSAYASGLEVKAQVPKLFTVTEARLITDEQITELRLGAGDPDNYKPMLAALWNKLPSTGVKVTSTNSGDRNAISLTFSESYPSFPKKNGSEPDIAQFHLLLKATTPQAENGKLEAVKEPTIYFQDFTNKTKSDKIASPTTKYVTVKGAWLKVGYTYKFVEKNEDGAFVESAHQDSLKPDSSCYLRVVLTAKNYGDDYAYRVNFTAILAKSVVLITEEMRPDLEYFHTRVGDETSVLLNTKRTFGPGDYSSETLILNLSPKNTRRLLASGSRLTFIKKVVAQIDMTASVGAIQAAQTIDTPLEFNVVDDVNTVTLTVTISRVDSVIVMNLKAEAFPGTTPTGQTLRYSFSVKHSDLHCENNVTDVNGDCNQTFPYTWKVLSPAVYSSTASYYLVPVDFSGKITFSWFYYKVETVDEDGKVLASAEHKLAYDFTSSPSNGGGGGGNNKNETEPTNKTDDTNKTNETIVVQRSKESGQALPLWALVMIPVAAVTIIVIAAILIIRRFRREKIQPDNSEIVEAIENGK